MNTTHKHPIQVVNKKSDPEKHRHYMEGPSICTDEMASVHVSIAPPLFKE